MSFLSASYVFFHHCSRCHNHSIEPDQLNSICMTFRILDDRRGGRGRSKTQNLDSEESVGSDGV